MKTSVYRLFVERKPGFDNEARRALAELVNFVGVTHIEKIRYCNRYDIEGIDDATLQKAATRVFSEPQSDTVHFETLPVEPGETVLAIEYLPGQYDQRADSATQCLALLQPETHSTRETVRVRCARVWIFSGKLDTDDQAKIENYLINPVDSRKAQSDKPATLALETGTLSSISTIESFISMPDEALETWRAHAGLAMDRADILFLRDYFRGKGRNPTETEIRVLDTYWSDHCRHTTFNTVLERIDIEDGPFADTFKRALGCYTGIRAELYRNRTDKPVTLMDMAVIGAKELKRRGLLDDIEESAEINACSIFIDVKITDDDGNTTHTEPWLLMFKNETHNHPTEIEPFGGAATCIGGAIRDPLSGRAWVYQALRVTGAGDPTVPISETIPGKLPQIKLTREAAAGFSAYGNQIGLTTGQVVEYYHPGFLAKRMELGAVIAATPVSSVVREEPEAGDVIIMVGGGTGRDGIGGATGSSKAHTAESVSTAGAEVQKGNAVEERKIQRLFRNPQTTRLVRRCNDFGAGGVAVAVGELAPGLDINLDAVPKKYEGLNGTELAISESQERMAVVVRAKDAPAFIAAANAENLNAAIIAFVTAEPRLVMRWQGKTIVDIDRSFLDTAGASRSAHARIGQPSGTWAWLPEKAATALCADTETAWHAILSDLSCASQRGLIERFDGSIGSSSVLFPLGGAYQSTPECGMAARIPVGPGKETPTVSLMTMGYDPKAATWSPFHGAQYAILESLAKILALGGDPRTARLTFQEYFERTSSPEAWGKPAAAVLGALEAQLEMGTAAIGGKDSMSGTFHELTVPPTLVSFAVAVTDEQHVRGGSLTAAGKHVVLVRAPWLRDGTPDWTAFKNNIDQVLPLSKAISAAYPVGPGGIAAALSKMAFGNRIGVNILPEALDRIELSAPLPVPENTPASRAVLFAPLYGSLILELDADNAARLPEESSLWITLGTTTKDPAIIMSGMRIPLDSAQMSWEKPLSRVFPPVSGILPESGIPVWAAELPKGGSRRNCSSSQPSPARNVPAKVPEHLRTAKPVVVLPVFPGTNCEYDMARAFRLAGAETRFVVLRNRTAEDLAASIAELGSAIDDSHILAFSGGFSAGDEPDGSGKFIANVIRERRISDAIMTLLENRKGLILGICNGFQALIKTGLLPYGTIMSPSEEMPTLTYNSIGRHISRFAATRITSDISPWAGTDRLSQGKIHQIPVSHGEGRVIIEASLAQKLFEQGQVFSQYVDHNGFPVMTEPDNPNGSQYAIEGLTSPCGRILGKMGHSERPLDTRTHSAQAALYKNIPGDTCQDIFTAGVHYWLA